MAALPWCSWDPEQRSGRAGATWWKLLRISIGMGGACNHGEIKEGFCNKTDLYEYCWYHKYVCRPSQDACGQEGRSRTWCTHAGHTRKHGNFKHLPLNNSNHVFFNPTSGRLPMCSWHPHTSFSGFSPAVCIHPSLSCLINKFVKCWFCRDFSIFLWNETVTWKGELIYCTNVWNKKCADCRTEK